MNYVPPATAVNESGFPHGPRSGLEFVAIPAADGGEELTAPEFELADASGRIPGGRPHPLRIEIKLVGVAEEVSKSVQFPDGAAAKRPSVDSASRA